MATEIAIATQIENNVKAGENKDRSKIVIDWFDQLTQSLTMNREKWEADIVKIKAQVEEGRSSEFYTLLHYAVGSENIGYPAPIEFFGIPDFAQAAYQIKKLRRKIEDQRSFFCGCEIILKSYYININDAADDVRVLIDLCPSLRHKENARTSGCGYTAERIFYDCIIL